jgi:hypothetical protein
MHPRAQMREAQTALVLAGMACLAKAGRRGRTHIFESSFYRFDRWHQNLRGHHALPRFA